MVEKGANKICASSPPFSGNARKKFFLQGVFRNGGILRNPIKIIKAGQDRQTTMNTVVQIIYKRDMQISNCTVFTN